MHAHVLVLVPTPDNIQKQIEQLLAPYEETAPSETEEDNQSSSSPLFYWDWYVIGGRWQGYLSMKERCAKCSADWKHIYSRAHNTLIGNTAVLPNIREDVSARAVVAPDGVWARKEVYQVYSEESWIDLSPEQYQEKDKELGELWRPEFIQVLASHRGFTAVSVDCHH